MAEFDLDGVKMNVVRTAETGVVNNETIFEFRQRADLVTARYAGGCVVEGYLVGRLEGPKLTFRYCQADRQGNLDGGVSDCFLERLEDGRMMMTERFTWESRDQAGENVFEELKAE